MFVYFKIQDTAADCTGLFNTMQPKDVILTSSEHMATWTTIATPTNRLNVFGVESDPCKRFSTLCNTISAIDTIPSYCECADDGIWTIIQRRFDGSVDFNRNWAEYKEGFGDVNREFWLGNDAIHQITSCGIYSLKICLNAWDNIAYAMFDTFKIAEESDGYRLTISGFSGDAGDSMTYGHNGQMFSTKDRDNDARADFEMAELFSGAWWFGVTAFSSLNGPYHSEPNVSREFGIMWWEYNRMTGYSMKETKMLIKPVL